LEIDSHFEIAKRNYLFLAEKLGIKDNVVTKYNNLLKILERDIKIGKLDEVEKVAKQILEIFPNDLVAKFYLANVYYSQNKVEDAIRLYKEIISLQPENLNARYNLSLALMKKNEFDEAEENLQYILSKDPNNQIIKQQLQQLQELKKIYIH